MEMVPLDLVLVSAAGTFLLLAADVVDFLSRSRPARANSADEGTCCAGSRSVAPLHAT